MLNVQFEFDVARLARWRCYNWHINQVVVRPVNRFETS